jgi:hypothetical protein
MTAPQILCIVCQTHPYDPPKGCEFCPESVLHLLVLQEAEAARRRAEQRELVTSGGR